MKTMYLVAAFSDVYKHFNLSYLWYTVYEMTIKNKLYIIYKFAKQIMFDDNVVFKYKTISYLMMMFNVFINIF